MTEYVYLLLSEPKQRLVELMPNAISNRAKAIQKIQPELFQKIMNDQNN